MGSILTEKGPRIIGRWFDKHLYVDGTIEYGQHGEFEWGYNQIQNTFASLLAGWCVQEATYTEGINVLAVGSGLVGWDSSFPTSFDYNRTTLIAEYFRKGITEGTDSYFINPADDSPSVTPTCKIEIVVLLDLAEANGDMREYGLFGGSANPASPGGKDTGMMVNWVAHSKITKDSSFQIERRIKILFGTL
jgi:hypothetical protein